MRHAKSDWGAGRADHERPLNDRGIRSARIMGRLLTDLDLVPSRLVSSTAVRARSTASLAIEAGEWDLAVELDPSLYGAGVDDVIGTISNASPFDRLMVVGHQPTWSVLVSEVTGRSVEMKTATVAVIDWSSRSLQGVHQPRDYFGTEFDG